MDILVNPNTFSAIFWTALTFISLVVVLAVFAWPRILFALEEREKRIQGAIEGAEARQAEAEAVLARYQAQLETARSDARKIIDEGKADAESLKARYLGEQQKEGEALKKRALREIELARDKALHELRAGAVDLSLQIASQLIEKNLTAKDQGAIIEKALAEAGTAFRAGDGA